MLLRGRAGAPERESAEVGGFGPPPRCECRLAGWEETRRVENLRRKRRVEREEAERDHTRRVAAERAAGEERKRLAKREGQAKRAEEVRNSQ